MVARNMRQVAANTCPPTAGGRVTTGPKAGSRHGEASCRSRVGTATTTEQTRLHFVYDAWNRLTQVWEESGGGTTFDPGDDTQVAEHQYDGLHRRVRKVNYEDDPDTTYDYYYSLSWQVLEVRKGGQTDPYQQFVWGVRYIDAAVVRFYDADTDGAGIEEHYYTNDANMNVTALVEADGDVAERYVYDPYGKPTIYDDDWSDTVAWSAGKNNEVLYCGYRYDSESGLYHVRNRMYHPTLARWMQRDRAGYVDGMSLYEYVRSAPVAGRDPYGRKVEKEAIASAKEVRKFARRYQGEADKEFKKWIHTRSGERLLDSIAGTGEDAQGRRLAAIQYFQNLSRVGTLSMRFRPGLKGEGVGNKFVYTCKGAFIDVGHYVISAALAYVAGERASLDAGYALELSQEAAWQVTQGRRFPGQGWGPRFLRWLKKEWAPSAFTTEDLYSNKLGARAGQDMRDATLKFNQANQARARAWSNPWIPFGKLIAYLLYLRPYDIAGRLDRDLKHLNPVDPNNRVGGGKRAMYYLRLMADDTAKRENAVYTFEARKGKYHSCVCDKHDRPIRRLW